MEILDMQMTRY